MNISSMSSTQSLWNVQMNVSSRAAPAPTPSRASESGQAAEELLQVLSQGRNASPNQASEVSGANSTSRHQGPPPLDLMSDRIALGLSGASGSEQGKSPSQSGFSQEDLAALKQAVETKGQAISEGLSRLIEQFGTTDVNQNGRISREEFAAFAEQNGYTMPPGAQPAQAASPGTSSPGGFPGFSKQDLEGLRKSLEQGMQAISQALTQMVQSISDSSSTARPGIDLQELLSGANQPAASATKNQPMIQIRLNPAQGDAKGISKEDLEGLKKMLEESGIEVPDALNQLLEKFEDIDQNQDGSLAGDELKAFRESGAKETGAASGSKAENSASAGITAGAESGNPASESVAGSFNRLLSQQMAKAYSYSASVRYESFQASYQTNMVA